MTYANISRRLLLGTLMSASIVILALSLLVFWTAWGEFKEREKMEAAFKRMNYPDPRPVNELLGTADYRFPIPLKSDYSFPTSFETPDEDLDVQLIVDVYRGKHNWYCLVQHVRFAEFDGTSGPQFGVPGIDVYRLKRPPDFYSAQTARGRNQPRPVYFKGKPAHAAYALDFADIVAGTASEKPTMDAELIHSSWIAKGSPK